jgi:hypothetical protein
MAASKPAPTVRTLKPVATRSTSQTIEQMKVAKPKIMVCMVCPLRSGDTITLRLEAVHTPYGQNFGHMTQARE